MSISVHSRFSTKLILLIGLVFLIPVVTSLALLLSTSQSSLDRIDHALRGDQESQRNFLQSVVPPFDAVKLPPTATLQMLREYERRRSFGLITGLIAISFVLSAVIVLISSLVLKRGMLSLRELSKAAYEVGHGHFDVRLCPSRSHDEFAQLTSAFDMMTRRLKETVVLRDFFNQVLQSMPAAVFTVNTEGMITSWNRHAERLTGIIAKDVLGYDVKGLIDVIGQEPAPSDLPIFARETVIRPMRGGQRIVSRGVDRLYDQSGKDAGMITTFVDITEIKTLERNLLMAKEVAEEASQLRSEFLANMSHEFRTPLNGIMGLAEVLMEEEGDPERRESLEQIRRCGQNLLHIINEVLDLSKLEAGRMIIRPTLVATRDAIREAVSTIEVGCRRKGLELIVEIDEAVPPTLEVDDRKLIQILINLLGNALKFTERGFIRLEVRPYRGVHHGTILFCVRDSGIGIPKERQPHIFESFVQVEHHLSRTNEGTGLGLPISKKLIELMGGEIWLESEPGEGSAFCFTISPEKGEKIV